MALDGQGTQFALVRKDGLDDFFLLENRIFTSESPTVFQPTEKDHQLLAYDLLGSSEASLLNLGLSSGLFGQALELDGDTRIPAPATGLSTYTFELKAHSNIPKTLVHNKGQVEIDALFVEERDGQETLFVLEAKTGDDKKSLAKHKLVYPSLALAQHVPEDMPIIPVYVKIITSNTGTHYHVVECELPNPREDTVAVNELTTKKHSHLLIPSQKNTSLEHDD